MNAVRLLFSSHDRIHVCGTVSDRFALISRHRWLVRSRVVASALSTRSPLLVQTSVVDDPPATTCLASRSSELCPRLGSFRRFATKKANFTAALLARGSRLPSDRRLARPSRSANWGARAVACGRKLNAREPAGLRGRVRRRGARSYAAAHASCALEALQATHGARYGREAHGTQQTPTGTRLPTRSAPPRPPLAPLAEAREHRDSVAG